MLDGSQAILALNKMERALLLAVSVALAAALGQLLFLFVAAGLLWRLFTRDDSPQGSRAITGYFASLLAALAIVLWLMPGAGMGR